MRFIEMNGRALISILQPDETSAVPAAIFRRRSLPDPYGRARFSKAENLLQRR